MGTMTGPAERRVSAGTVAGLLVSLAVIDVVTTRLTPDPIDPFFRFAAVVGVVVWARRSVQLSWDELGCGRAKAGSGLRWGLLAMLVVAAVVAIAIAIPATRSFFENDDVRADSALSHILEPLVVIPLSTVLFEEILFRGVLFGCLLRFTTQVRAVVICSVAFGLWHIPPALSDANGESAIAAVGVVLGTIAFTTAAGALFCWLRLRSGSLLAPILAHIGSNSISYAGALVALDS
jgi:membrane protease YdiL (CAAX protease family)